MALERTACCAATAPGGSASASAWSPSATAPASRSRSPRCRRPRLAELCQTHGRERAALRPRRASAAAVPCRCPSPHGLRWMVGEGALLPLHVGSAGRVLIGRARAARLGRDGRGARAGRRVGERTGRRSRRRGARRGQRRRAGRAPDAPSRARASVPTSSRPPPTSPRRCDSVRTAPIGLRRPSRIHWTHDGDAVEADGSRRLPTTGPSRSVASRPSETRSSSPTTTSCPRSRTSPTTSATRSACRGSPPPPTRRRSCSAACTSWPRRRRSSATTRRC